MLQLVTPRSRLPFWALLAVLVVSGPLLDIGEHYNPETGYVYKPFGLDALTVRPIDWLALWTLLGLPLVVVTWLALREYPGSVSLLSVNRKRPYWTLGLSITCVVAIVSVSQAVWSSTSRPLWAGVWAIRSLAWAYWFLLIRSALVVSNAFAKPAPVTKSAT